MTVEKLRNNPGFAIEDVEEQRAPSWTAQALTIALSALSQRAVVALAALFSILLAASVFALYWKVLPNPTYESLAGLALYSVFIIALHVVRKRQ